MREQERAREAQRQQEAARGAGVESSLPPRGAGVGSSLPPRTTLTSTAASAKKGQMQQTPSRDEADSGWVGVATGGRGGPSSSEEEDPFVVQRKQLMGFIQQARQGGRQDEVVTLQASLREIERIMDERQRGVIM